MVKIRYAELPAGLHVATEAGDRCTIVYLKPGLTKAQRKDALTVARRSARFGHGPSLPTLDMAFALAADRTRMAARIFTTAMRKHPLLLLPVVALVAALIAVGVLASAAIVITAPPHVRSAPSDISQVNISQPGSLAASHSRAPSQGPPTTGAAGAPGGSSSPTTWHGDGLHRGRYNRGHLAAGTRQVHWER
jgi:hypothetical protein